MARPTLPARIKRSETVYISVTRDEKKTIEAAQKKSGKSTVSEWLREIVKKECERVLTG